MLIRDIMIKDVGSLHKDATLTEAAELMREHQIGSIVVVRRKGEKLFPIGIITDRDIVVEVVAENVESGRLTVDDVMSREVITVRADSSIMSAIQHMERGGIRRLPVVDGEGALQGIITADDISARLASAINMLSKVPGIQRAVEHQVQQWRF